MKYDTWNVRELSSVSIKALIQSGISPLVSTALISHGYDTPEAARNLLASGRQPLLDPLGLPDMEKAAARVRRAVAQHEKIAVFGDYDVDGITATCLITDFLTAMHADCIWYIPARLEEGYGLNKTAIRGLKALNVSLIVSVDCGVTAIEEAKLCRELSIDLVITDHHECMQQLPEAVAVVNPRRKDSQYGFEYLAGVGVAFKLAAAVLGDQGRIFHEYSDLVTLGTVADVMPLLGENRILVTEGITLMHHCRRPGLLALMQECQIAPDAVNSSVVGYTLAPRINAAGRMGQVELATDLFLTKDPDEAAVLAASLCRLNRQRQEIEAEIYEEAQTLLQGMQNIPAIVLAGENWHQGVVGIVASRLVEDYGCPVFLICLSGEVGRASSRSCGGFSLFEALESLSDLLDNFGGHAQAAGFTIQRANIPEFRKRIFEMARSFYEIHPKGRTLTLDCAVPPEVLTVSNIADLDQLEPFGAGFSRPQFYMDNLRIEQIQEIGGGKHLKLRLSRDRQILEGVFFSTTACRASIAPGDLVEVAFAPQVNEFRGIRSVQMNITDIRPSYECRSAMEQEKSLYAHYQEGTLSEHMAVELIPPRQEFAAVWRYLAAHSEDGTLIDEFYVLARKIARSANLPCSFVRTRLCLDVLEERGLIQIQLHHPSILSIKLTPGSEKVDLLRSPILIRLQGKEEGDT